MNTIAVEPALNHVREYLQSKGCQCVDMRDGQPEGGDVCAIVINGTDKNLMGMHDVVHDVPVINAEGMTPEQVYDRVKRYLH